MLLTIQVFAAYANSSQQKSKEKSDADKRGFSGIPRIIRVLNSLNIRVNPSDQRSSVSNFFLFIRLRQVAALGFIERPAVDTWLPAPLRDTRFSPQVSFYSLKCVH
ncbi:hypothetical protein Pr1d_20670 [Bythopirellula goksoeyrii]|uniref:Uncharacterized protein n=1 Tax=Bythopirellula goksoeyrii TaxID=1400387 RepID=A0A5B9QL33_9BACT|nr:hypothetical protein Pr1d_20670 [Bythopirellula goksoeyrii]